MTDYREILRLNHQGISGRDIAKSCGCSRNTVARVLGKAREHGMTWQSAEEKTNGDLRDLFFPGVPAPFSRTRPDCEYIHREMGKSGVTFTLLWQEYCEKCRTNGDIPLMYSQFCLCCQKYAQSAEATMRLVRRPGESAEVDWAGQKALWLDPDTGDRMEAPVFVGVLSSSRYAYVEAFSGQDQESWLTAHVNMFRYFGGVPRILVPDNLKTGITRADRYDPVINRVYRELAEHYGTAVIPARVRKPRDKPNAEGTVGIVTTWILAALRDRVFFSIRELNEGIAEKLERFNAKPFQKKEGSRLDAFLAEEKAALLPLPEIPYELSSWKKAVADKSYHVSVEKMLYSVPYEYIGHEMEIRLTRNVVEIFFDGQRVCSHTRLRGRPGQCSTVPSHMPPEHRKYSLWDGSRFVSWAEDVGPHTAVVMRGILSAHAVEQQSYRSCYGLVRLGDTCSFERLEAACEKALLYTPRPGYRNVKTILTTGQDRVKTSPAVPETARQDKDSESYGLVRGAEYYGGKK